MSVIVSVMSQCLLLRSLLLAPVPGGRNQQVHDEDRKNELHPRGGHPT